MPTWLRAFPFTTSQAAAAGVSRGQLRGPAYRRVLRDVYVAATVTDGVETRARAVGLVLPPDAVVGYVTSAWLQGAELADGRTLDIDVISQRGDQIRRRGVRATSALLEPEDVTTVLGVPVTTPVRTAFDLARREDLVEAVVGVDAMLNRGGCDLAALADYAASHRGWRYVRTVDQALRHAEPLSQSPMESRQRMRFVLAGLPRPTAQVPISDEAGRVFAYIDNGYDEWKVGAEYDGAHHRDQWQADLDRQERIRGRGWWHRRYTSLNIRTGWAAMVDEVGRALVAAGWSPP